MTRNTSEVAIVTENKAGAPEASTCVYRKLKHGHNGDAVRQGSRGNGYFQLVELGARKARPYLVSDAFAIHYNRRHTRLESGAGAVCTENPIRIDWRRESPNVSAQ